MLRRSWKEKIFNEHILETRPRKVLVTMIHADIERIEWFEYKISVINVSL